MADARLARMKNINNAAKNFKIGPVIMRFGNKFSGVLHTIQ